jgi:hypothetical protein
MNKLISVLFFIWLLSPPIFSADKSDVILLHIVEFNVMSSRSAVDALTKIERPDELIENARGELIANLVLTSLRLEYFSSALLEADKTREKSTKMKNDIDDYLLNNHLKKLIEMRGKMREDFKEIGTSEMEQWIGENMKIMNKYIDDLEKRGR